MEFKNAGVGRNTQVSCGFIEYRDKGNNVKLRGYSEQDWKKIGIFDRFACRISGRCVDVTIKDKSGKEQKIVIVKDHYFKESFGAKLPSNKELGKMLEQVSKGQIKPGDSTLVRADVAGGLPGGSSASVEEVVESLVAGEKPLSPQDASKLGVKQGSAERVVGDEPQGTLTANEPAAAQRQPSAVGSKPGSPVMGRAAEPEKAERKEIQGANERERMTDLVNNLKQRLHTATSSVGSEEGAKKILEAVAGGIQWTPTKNAKAALNRTRAAIDETHQASFDQLVVKAGFEVENGKVK